MLHPVLCLFVVDLEVDEVLCQVDERYEAKNLASRLQRSLARRPRPLRLPHGHEFGWHGAPLSVALVQIRSLHVW